MNDRLQSSDIPHLASARVLPDHTTEDTERTFRYAGICFIAFHASVSFAPFFLPIVFGLFTHDAQRW